MQLTKPLLLACIGLSLQADTALSPTLCGVGGVANRTRYAEPWKASVLSATSSCTPQPATVDWTIKFEPAEGRLNPIPKRMTESERETQYVASPSLITHNFSYPGNYTVCVKESAGAAGEVSCSTIKNRYVNRELSLVTESEWSAFARAMNVVKHTSTMEGRLLYGENCLYNDTEFYTHDAFVALHFTLAANYSGDQAHFLALMEPAHQSWTSKLQQALRCVDRTVSHIWSDFTFDFDNSDKTDRSMLSFPVFSATRYGGASNYFKSDSDPAYVTDGAFANWTVTQTKNVSTLCGDLEEMVDGEAMRRCKHVLGRSRSVGYSALQPKSADEMQYVSRKSYYMLGRDGLCTNSASTMASLRNAISDPSMGLTHEHGLSLSRTLHGFGHDCISGKWWMPSSPKPHFTDDFLAAFGVISEDELMDLSNFMLSVMKVALGNDVVSNVQADLDDSVVCHDEYCACEQWFNPNEIDHPDVDLTTLFNVYPNAKLTDTWDRFINESRNLLFLNACNWPRSGTFDWSASANQDPIFYAYHWHTFAWVYKAAQTITEASGVTFNEAAPGFLSSEAPGGRYYDVTSFKNLVPYRAGQVEGEFHTWKDILTHFFSNEEFVFEYPEYQESHEDTAYRATMHAAKCFEECAAIHLGLIYEALFPRISAEESELQALIESLQCGFLIVVFEDSLSSNPAFAPCYAPTNITNTTMPPPPLSPPAPPPPSAPPLPPLSPGETLLYIVSWNVTTTSPLSTTTTSSSPDASPAATTYSTLWSDVLGVPLSAVSVRVIDPPIGMTTRVSTHSEAEAERVSAEASDTCTLAPEDFMIDSCSTPVISVDTVMRIVGDPHFLGADSDRIDFKGEDGAVYNLLSAHCLALNARFTHASFSMGGACSACSHKTVHGSFITEVYFRALTETGKTLTVKYKAEEPSHASLTTSNAGEEELAFLATERGLGVSQNQPDAVEEKIDDVSVTLTRKHAREAALTVRNGEFEVEAASRFLGYAKQNGNRKRLDLSIVPLKDVAHSKVAPHGLLGQTFDGDGVAVDGALDDYSGKAVVTKAMGEGAIEGVADDYKLPPDRPFSMQFKYSRFATTAALPRDTSKLTGVHRKVGGPTFAAANSAGDDVAVAAA